MSQEYLSSREAAALCGFTPASFASRRARGTGPKFTRVGYRTVRYRYQDLIDWLADDLGCGVDAGKVIDANAAKAGAL
jgi:predicted DNA-binding transcriptional regulator AlpA